jgi:hypothetical protein
MSDRRDMRIQIRLAVVGLAVLAGATACGKNAPPHVASATTTSIAPLRQATGTPIFDIASTGHEPLNVDFNTLDALATKTYSVVEPFEHKTIAFKGVDLGAVLHAAGVPDTATSVHLGALDDYQIDIPMADIRKGGIILAVRADGALIPVDHGGPSRVVYLDGVAAGANPDQWIWSINHITVT